MPNGIVTAAMAKTDAREQLRRVPLFRGLSNDELQQLSQLVKEQSYKAGAPIVEEGQTGLGLYVIRPERLLRRDRRPGRRASDRQRDRR
jgi:hypothetical protein